MKKIAVFCCLFIILLSSSAFASGSFEEALYNKLSGEGIFDGENGVIYAEKLNFENTASLFIVSAADKEILCEIYGDADGLQLTDSLAFSGDCRVAVVKDANSSCIMLERGGEKSFYTLQNDFFVTADITDYSAASYIAGIENGKIVSYAPAVSVYNLLNRLKEEAISGYTLTNKINLLSGEAAAEIKKTLTACADLMSFDIKNYDYNTIFKYVLFTHRNFKILTDIPPMSSESVTLGQDSVSLVGSEFIDYVMLRVLRITPEKPPVNNLLTRGFCYNDGYYLYTGGFDVYFSTEVLNLTGVYDLGGNVIFVIFTDIYREGNLEIPEYSFAVLQSTNEGYSLLRLGMGEKLPSVEEVRLYSPFSSYGEAGWSEVGEEHTNSRIILPVLLGVICIGIVGIACSVIVFIRTRR